MEHRKKAEDETEKNYTKKMKNKQTTTTTKNNHTLRMQKMSVSRVQLCLGSKSSPIFSFFFFSPAMQSGIKNLLSTGADY